jgi:hypothetical protein
MRHDSVGSDSRLGDEDQADVLFMNMLFQRTVDKMPKTFRAEGGRSGLHHPADEKIHS